MNTDIPSRQVLRMALSGLLVLVCLVKVPLLAQSGQIDINRVNQMPDFPTPYIMRDWKTVAIRYDSLVYSLSATGQYLPLMQLKPAGINYPSIQPIVFDSFVGAASHGTQAEAVNIIPSLVGASLVGIDKSNQSGTNWVLKAKEFFNKANGQDVYLNGYASSSGFDWWYDLMPNVFFYQLYDQYPGDVDFNTQFTRVADRWLAAVYAMGGSTLPWTVPQLNYVAFNLATMTPNSNGITEPESAGTIAWLLYHAWKETGNKKYLDGAQLAMTFLSNLNFNPAYEIQLPYGSLVAAKMNAELGTHYNLEKMVNWSFDQSAQRNWGTIVGNWAGADVSGLIGEVDNPNTGYAFAMNGFEQAAALVPMVKYDKRFARAMAKWTLNVANASRLFYPEYLPAANQDDFIWSSVHDPHSVIGYEGLKQNFNGKTLYGTGDAKANGWAATNLGLYGSSHVGYLAALIGKTDVDGILMLDVNKTDFFGENAFPSYVVYNPGVTTNVTLPLGSITYDIYDAISETTLHSGATGNFSTTLPANSVRLLVYLPAGSVPVAENGQLKLGNQVVDFHYGYNFDGALRIRSLSAKDSLVEFNQVEKLYSSIENSDPSPVFQWYVNGTLYATTADSVLNWSVPAVAGFYNLLLKVSNGSVSVKDSLQFHVVSHIPVPPLVTGIASDSVWYATGSIATFLCTASNPDATKLQYNWTLTGGVLIYQNDSIAKFQVPSGQGMFEVDCEVTNHDVLSVIAHSPVLVKSKSAGITSPLAYYPLDGNVADYSGNGRNGALAGAQPASDPRGEPNKAYHFSSTGDVIYVANDAGLNFQNQITLSFWLKLDGVPLESYVISHGSYEERWKVSVIANNRLRWTVKTSTGVMDLDSSFPLLLNTYYHFTVVYTGYSLELYVNGILDSFLPDTGLMLITNKEITFGRKNMSTTAYHLYGALDEIRIYNVALMPDEIATLPALWNLTTSVLNAQEELVIYPNPARGAVFIRGLQEPLKAVSMMDVFGRNIPLSYVNSDGGETIHIEFSASGTGIMLIKIETTGTTYYRKVMVF